MLYRYENVRLYSFSVVSKALFTNDRCNLVAAYTLRLGLTWFHIHRLFLLFAVPPSVVPDGDDKFIRNFNPEIIAEGPSFTHTRVCLSL